MCITWHCSELILKEVIFVQLMWRLCFKMFCQKTTARTMIRMEYHIWARSQEQAVVENVLVGQISVVIQPISFRTVITKGHQTTAVIQIRTRIELGATGAADSGITVGSEVAVNCLFCAPLNWEFLWHYVLMNLMTRARYCALPICFFAYEFRQVLRCPDDCIVGLLL